MTLTERIEDVYFDWLCAKVLEPHQKHNPNYHDLFRIMHSEEFVWDPDVIGDHNRADDGKELRIDFLRALEIDHEEEPDWFDGPCSVFEMLIAFAMRFEFQTDVPYKRWFWVFLDNLELKEFRRIQGERDVNAVEEILYTFIHRTYRADGHGGICPIKSPKCDQRTVELWAQMFEYLEDQGI